MLNIILVALALMLLASCAIALMVAWFENSAWSDYFDSNERDGEQ